MLLRKELSSTMHWEGNLLGPRFGPDVVMREVPAPAGNRTPVARSYMLKRRTKCLGNLRYSVYLTHIEGHFLPLSHGIWKTRRAASNLTVARIRRYPPGQTSVATPVQHRCFVWRAI